MMKSKLKTDPSILVIAGITGNLAKKYLLPALYDMTVSKMIPENFRVVGLSRKPITSSDLLDIVKESLVLKNMKIDKEALAHLSQMLSVCIMDISKQADYTKLRQALDEIEDQTQMCMHRLFYLAIPPKMYPSVIEDLGTNGLNNGCQHGRTESRLLLEKPFGYDLESAKELIKTTKESFEENQIYRVDHYLAKQNAQNILAFRFQNPLFSKVWDKNHIDYITVTASETIGIETRASFYENTGAIRDFIQSHLLQLLSIATMEEPADDTPEALHQSKLKLLESIEPIKNVEEDVVIGQYEGYALEAENPDSTTETYAALKLNINNKRWNGVPVLLRTGKALEERVSEINFKFHDSETKKHPPSILTIRIQPKEGIVLSLVAKKPGFNNEMDVAQMQFSYDQDFDEALPNAYEYVLVDAMRGDQTLFPTTKEVLRSWEIIENTLNRSKNIKPVIYKKGSWGPKEADELASKNNASWIKHRLKIY